MTHNEAENIIKYMVKLSPLPPLPNDFIFGSYPPEALNDNSTNPLRKRKERQQTKKTKKPGEIRTEGEKSMATRTGGTALPHPFETTIRIILQTLETYQAIKYMTIMIKAKVSGCRMIKSKP